MSLIDHKLKLNDAIIEAPLVQVSWLPKLMQTYEGYLSIYG